jgi:hypothetical protein
VAPAGRRIAHDRAADDPEARVARGTGQHPVTRSVRRLRILVACRRRSRRPGVERDLGQQGQVRAARPGVRETIAQAFGRVIVEEDVTDQRHVHGFAHDRHRIPFADARTELHRPLVHPRGLPAHAEVFDSDDLCAGAGAGVPW